MKLDTNLPLRENVRLLGSILGTVIAKQEGVERLTQVEEIRSFSKAARGGEAGGPEGGLEPNAGSSQGPRRKGPRRVKAACRGKAPFGGWGRVADKGRA